LFSKLTDALFNTNVMVPTGYEKPLKLISVLGKPLEFMVKALKFQLKNSLSVECKNNLLICQ